MKTYIIASLFLLINTSVFSQKFDEICNKISKIDIGIVALDNDKIGFTNKEERYNDILHLVNIELLPLFTATDLTQDDILSRLDCIKSTETITWLEWALILEIKRIDSIFESTRTYPSIQQAPSQMKELQTLFHKRTEEIMSREFTLYSFTESSNKWIKAIYFEHQNDVFTFTNQDRDLTGAFRLEIATDKLKMRGVSTFKDKFYNWNSRGWYSYQGFFFGGEGYTPYLRDTTIFKTISSIDPDDRPYASYVYFGRAKYRISRLGRVKINTQTKIGKIGTAKGDRIQAAIHQDLTIGSVKPYGWGAQIAAGGRLALSFEIMGEYSFFKTTKKVLVKPTVFGEGTLGHDKTSIAGGFNFSNKYLKERGGWGVSFLNNKNGYLVWNIKPYARYVLHNSMLQGYGVFKRTPDENPLSPVDAHFLKNNQVNKFIYGVEISGGWSMKYMNFIFKQSFWSSEFNLPVNTKIYHYADNGKPGSHNRTIWNNTGTVGLVFKL